MGICISDGNLKEGGRYEEQYCTNWMLFLALAV